MSSSCLGRCLKKQRKFHCTKISDNPSGHGRPRRKSWTSAPRNVCFLGARVMGRNFLTLNMTNWVRYPLPFFLSNSPLESMRSGGAIHPPPPHERGIAAILARYPLQTRQNACGAPPLRYNLESVLRDVGGVSLRNARLFTILSLFAVFGGFVRNFGGVFASRLRPFFRNSRGNPSLCAY